MLSIARIKQAEPELENFMGTLVKYSKINASLDEDLFNRQLMTYYQAKENFEDGRGVKFNTYLTTLCARERSNYKRDADSGVDEEPTDFEKMKNFKDDVDIESTYIKERIYKQIIKEINKLNRRERFILKKRLFDNLTLREISDTIGLSHERVRCIIKEEIQKIKNKLNIEEVIM